jgi:hypothetical protein
MLEIFHGKNSEYIPRKFLVKFPEQYNSELFLRKIVFYYGYSEESTKEKFPGNFPTYSWKNSDIFSEKYRHILGKIPRNFFMLTPRIPCFIGDGSSEEST